MNELLFKVIVKTVACNNDNVESMPLSDKEIYTFHYDKIRGVSLAFT